MGIGFWHMWNSSRSVLATVKCVVVQCVFAAAVLGLLSGSLFGQGSDPNNLSIKRLVPPSSSRRDDGLQDTIHRVRDSFQNQQADQLETCFATKKVFISLRSKETEAGYYTRSQLHFIFDKVFRDLQTRSFNYSPSDVTVSRDGRAYFRSQWTYKVMGSDTTVTELLHFSLEKEDDDWRIFELKSVSQ